jgi:hypothetical protein
MLRTMVHLKAGDTDPSTGPMSEQEQPATDVGAGPPEDASPGVAYPSEHSENAVDDDHAPSTTTSEDGDAGQATGNPGAAGSESSADGGED